MGKVALVITYDESENDPPAELAIDVANMVRPLFEDKREYRVYLAVKESATDIVDFLAERRAS